MLGVSRATVYRYLSGTLLPRSFPGRGETRLVLNEVTVLARNVAHQIHPKPIPSDTRRVLAISRRASSCTAQAGWLRKCDDTL
jgi:hypothetical protein